MSSVLQKIFIESLPSKVYYRTNFESNFDYCSPFNENNNFKEKRAGLNNYEKIKSIEDKLTKALCHVAFTDDGVKCKEQCRFLYYWLGNELLLSNIEEKSFSEVIEILSNVSNVLYQRYKCNCTFFKGISKENFEKMKIVYDYCNDHDSIESTLKEYNNMCDSEFNTYLVKAETTYNEIYNCAKKNFSSYCIQLKSYVPSCFENKLSPLTCKIEEVSPEDQGSIRYSTTNIDPEY
ncbi:PIR Superfamily Protein, partial [Plasmodium malariae]